MWEERCGYACLDKCLSAARRQTGVDKHTRKQVVVLDMSRVPDIEYTALQVLIDEEKRMVESSISLWLVALNPSVLEEVRRTALPELLGKDCLLFNAREAIKQYKAIQAQRESRNE